MNHNNTLSHTTWNCKYHIVFAPKYRRQIIYRKIKADIGKILRKLCEYKGVRGNRGNSPRRSHTGSKHTTKIECIIIYVIFKRKKFIDDI